MTDWNSIEDVRAYRKAYNARYRIEHADVCKAAQKSWAVRNGAHIRKKRAEWAEKNRDHLNDLQRKSYRKNREDRLAQCKAYREKNREKVARWVKDWVNANRDKRLSILKRYRERHRDSLKAYNAEYGRKFPERKNGCRLRNPEKTRAQALVWARTRRTRIEKNGGCLTKKEWAAIQERQSFLCAMCGKSEKLTRDHIVPLVKGGPSDASNTQGLCWPCNAFKATRTMEEIVGRRAS